MGNFDPTTNAIYQEVDGAILGGVWAMPAYFNGTLYYGGVGDRIKAFPFQNARLAAQSSRTSGTFAYPGATPKHFSKWHQQWHLVGDGKHLAGSLARLRSNEPRHRDYNSTQAANNRDQFGAGNKFITPTIEARVYVGTTSGVGVFGLLDQSTLTPLQTWRDNHFGNPSNVGAGANGSSPAGDGVPNLIRSPLGLIRSRWRAPADCRPAGSARTAARAT